MGRIIVGVIAVLLGAATVRAQDAGRQDGWVVLPIEEYRTLRARANATPPDPAPPPLDATLSRVDYDLRITGETVTGQARLTIDVLKQGWVSVQVPSGMLVRDARLDGRPTAIVDGDPPRILIARAGRSILTLGVVVPLASSAGTESMTLPGPACALSAVTLTIPRIGVDLSVSGGFIVEQSESGSESRWIAYGTPGRPLTFSWKRKADDRRSTLPLKTRARIIELVALGEESTQITASVRVEVTQGVARQALVALPDGLVVNQVAGATVSDWTVDAGMLTVTFLEPIATDTSFLVTAEVRVPREGSIGVPLVRVPAADRETGGVAIDVVGAGEIGERQPRGLEPADPADLGDIIAGRESPSMAAFQFTPINGQSIRALTVHLSRYTPQAVLVANVEEARYDALVGEDGKSLIRVRYAVRNNQRSFLAVTLPSQAVLWTASLAGRPIRPGMSADGALLLPLEKGRSNQEAPTFVVELTYLQRGEAWSEKGDARVELPAADLPIARTGLTLRYSPKYAIELRPGTFRVATDPGPWSVNLRAIAEGVAAAPPPPPQPMATPGSGEREAKDLRALMDRYRKEAGRTGPGTVPLAIDFPSVGPTVFLAAELTQESRRPSFDIDYRKTGGRK
ncbi:MAG TPA: hypothetical protein VFT39_13825 [Vicinamibacterales bacterium]|nr:hypothetical protein [Vicinamibacterales bacterium]